MNKTQYLIFCFIFFAKIGFSQSDSTFNAEDSDIYYSSYLSEYKKNNLIFHVSNFRNDYFSDSNGGIDFICPIKKINSSFRIASNFGRNYFSSIKSTSFYYALSYSYKQKFNKKLSLNFGSQYSYSKYSQYGENNDLWSGETTIIDETNSYNHFQISSLLKYNNLYFGVFFNNLFNKFSISNFGISSIYNVKIGQNKLMNNLSIYNNFQYYTITNIFIIKKKYFFGLKTEFNYQKAITTSLYYVDSKLYIYISPSIGFKISDKYKFSTSFHLFDNNRIHNTLDINSTLSINF